MRTYRSSSRAQMRAFDRLMAARSRRFPPAVLRTAARIVEDVRRRGDAAVVAAVRRYDGVRLVTRGLRVPPARIRAAWQALPAADRRALRASWDRILAYHRRQVPRGYRVRTGLGSFTHVIRPLGRVAIHIPAGAAPLVSTLLMCAGAARAAGVRDLVLVSPPRGGQVHPAILAAAWLAGIREAYNAGGAQGVAALALGTGTIRAADRVVGPGNLWSQAARWITQGAGLDGPSEIAVLADATARAEAVAADLVAQAEHAGDNPAVLVTPSHTLAAAVAMEVGRQLRTLPRAAVARTSFRRFGATVLVRSLLEGLSVCERFAPEHLAIVARGADRLARRARCAGTVLIGASSPVAAADYGVGPNHVLPTAGTARYASGLGVKDFLKFVNLTRLSARGLKAAGPGLARIARMEGLEGHARSLEINRG